MTTKKHYKEENLWNYLKAKLYVKGIDDNNLTAKQVYNYITKHFKVKTKMTTKKHYKEENLWNYLKAKLYVKGIDDNNLTAKQVYNYITKHFKVKTK